MGIYGRDFAEAYNERWAFWGPKMWPFLSKLVARRRPNATTWLDLCCGTGSLLELVCDAGFEAVGVDLSPHQLKHAQKNAPAARLVRADVRDVRLGRSFDVVTCLFDSLNYLTTMRDLAKAFRNVRRHLADRGLFIFDMNTLAGIRAHWRHAVILRDPGRVLINETSFEPTRKHGICRLTGFVRQGRLWRRFVEEHVERAYTPDEIESLLARARLRFVTYDGHTLRRPKAASGRLLYVCQEAEGER